MMVTGVNGTNVSAGTQGQSVNMASADEYSKGIRQQISEKQQELSELSANQELSMEEKMEKRQALQQEITALQQQLRQHQIEQRKQSQGEQQVKQPQTESQSAQRQESSSQAGMQGLSGSVMAAMLSADGAVQQSKVQGRVASHMENQANILESEIRQDKARGADTTQKEKDLADMRTRTQAVTSSQIENNAKGLTYLQELQKKYSNSYFGVGTVSYGQTAGKSSCVNFIVSPEYLSKLGTDGDAQKQFAEDVDYLYNYSQNRKAQKAASGWEVVSEGWFCDENGDWGGWVVTRKTDEKSFLQKMQEKSDEIRDAKIEKKQEQKKLKEQQAAKEKAEESLKEHFGSKFKGITVTEVNQNSKSTPKNAATKSVLVDVKA